MPFGWTDPSRDNNQVRLVFGVTGGSEVQEHHSRMNASFVRQSKTGDVLQKDKSR